jgi:chemotaxis protein CheD
MTAKVKMQNSCILKPQIFLHTGDVYIGVSPTMVSTVLGSCVAITMHEPDMEQGIICHSFLPRVSESRDRVNGRIQICRYVDTAVEHLLQTMLKLGAKKKNLEIKLFGGSNGIANKRVRVSSAFSVGERNVSTALECLAKHSLKPIAMDVGGNVGRKLFFDTQTGDIWLKRLGKLGSSLADK